MTELSFLLELFLDPELPCSMRDKLVARIREVETKLISQATLPQLNHRVTTNQPGNIEFYQPPNVPKQAPSTLAIMAKHGDIPPMPPLPQETFVEPPVAVIAQTQATAAAMQSRNQAIADSIAGKTDKVTGRPRKW